MLKKKKKSTVKSKTSAARTTTPARPKSKKAGQATKTRKKAMKRSKPSTAATRRAAVKKLVTKAGRSTGVHEDNVESLTPAEIDAELAAYDRSAHRPEAKTPPVALHHLASRIAQCMFEKKAEDVKVFDLKGLTSVTDFFVVATATSELHVKAVADHIQSTLEDEGVRAHHVEGYGGMTWVLLDYIDVVAHVFQPSAREYYDLERLWGDARITEITDPILG